MPAMSTDAKALMYLSERRVRAERVDARTGTATFRVLGSAPVAYAVHFTGGHWSCDCPARVEACAHVKACSLVSAPLGSTATATRPVRARRSLAVAQ